MSEEFIIGLFWGVFGTLLVQLATMMIYRLGSRRTRREMEATAPKAPTREIEGELQAAQLDRMQQRLAVLEKITTDTGFRTARAIDDLR